MKKILFLVLLFFLFFAGYALAQHRDPCGPSLKLKLPEHGYGYPSPPVDYVDDSTYEDEQNKLASKKDFNTLYRLAYMAFVLKKYKEAIGYFRSAESLQDKIPHVPSGAHFYTYFAMTYEAIGDLEKAKDYYIKSGDPYYIHLIKARIFRKQNNYEKAKVEYLLAQSVSLYELQNYEPYQELSEMYFNNKQYALAKLYISKYIECAQYEFSGGGLGYVPSDDSHIKKARIFLREIDTLMKH
jgi:tetratricopeptide (TPR) repeat protein